MRDTVVFNLVILLVLVASAPGTTQLASDGYAPNEIIIKLRDTATDTVEEPATGRGLQALASNLILPQGLDELNERYGVREVKPLLKKFRQKQQRTTSLHTAGVTSLTQKEKHILRRLKRAPKDITVPDLSRIYRIKLDCEPQSAPGGLQEVIEAYQNNPYIEYAELNQIVSIDLAADDDFYRTQWSLQTINAEDAWDISTGSSDVIVAMIDTGVDYSHRDLQSNMWVNEAELNGINGQDDDKNDYIDDIYGYNFIYNNSDPADDHGHGTHCAGIVAARGNNNLDIAGICWSTKIMALKFLGSSGEGTTADVVLALYYAVENGADIISNSWGSNSESNALKDAIDYAQSQGVILVAAAGNNNSNSPHYPGGYENVLSVTATDADDNKWSLSNYGDWVDIAAPGVDILSLKADGTSQGVSYNPSTAILSGTSMAAPHIAGACALLLSTNPILSHNQLYETLTQTVDPISPGICLSNGRLNLSKAIHAVIPTRGYISLDRDYYTFDSTIGIFLADWDLRSKGSQDAIFVADNGDSETVILTEKSSTLGVFTGTISVDLSEPNIEDGIIQVSASKDIVVMYFDANDGSGNPAIAMDSAVTDYEPPELLQVQVQTRGPTAGIELVTNEPASAKVHWGLTCTRPFTSVKKDVVMSTSHTINLQGLFLKTDYYFCIELLDAAGNKITEDNDGLCYSFTTPEKFLGFYVPSLYPTIQAAINDASDGDTVWITDGRYTGEGNYDIDFQGKAITVKSENGPENCIVDCQRYGRGFHFHSSEDANSVLDGFTITNGTAERFGGGIRCTASSPMIINCIITGNSASDYGGGMYNCYNSNPTIINCTFSENKSESLCILGNGGGMCNSSNSNPTVTNCKFVNNSVSYSGGGMYNHKNSNPIITSCIFRSNSTGRSGGGMINWHSSSPILTNCKFSSNHSEDGGGGMCNYYDSNPTIKNTIFNNNSAEKFGGGMKNYESSPMLNNCTVSGCQAESTGGIWNGPSSSTTLTNCILWGNSDNDGMDESAQISPDVHQGNETSVINYCCIQNLTGMLGGIGNIVANPHFVDAENEDYHLKSEAWRWDKIRQRWDYDDVTSPCIDAGNPGSLLENELLTVPDDPNNNWGVNLRINMGAYGGTIEASMPTHGASLLADMTNDGLVTLEDFAAQALYWSPKDWLNGNLLNPDVHRDQLPITNSMPGDLNRDGLVNAADLVLLAEDWLKHKSDASLVVNNTN